MTSEMRSGLHGESVARWRTPAFDEHARAAEDERALEEICQDAWQEGFEKGRQEGLQKFSRDMREKLQAMDDLLNALQQPFDKLNEQVGEELLQLAARIAKSLVRRELRTEPETIIALVRDTVSALHNTRQDIEIHLHPEDARVVRELTQLADREQCWKLMEDPLIVRGECKVYSQDSIIDASLQKRINLVVTQCLGDERWEART